MGGFEDVILPRLWPDDLGMLMVILAVWRFVILILALLVLLMQPEGSTFVVVLLAAVGIFMIMDAIWVFSQYQGDIGFFGWCSHTRSIGSLLIRIGSFALPLFVAGITKSRQARGWALLLASLSATYFFTAWWFYQRPPNCP